ncbi:DUF1415 domain-containing protein [Ningiella sp. W23]|uniref:DUF1415 domain-containing protein n=1 Tax=Ningiella sp. W23 TaxID=3023715 RepID=UPI003757D905
MISISKTLPVKLRISMVAIHIDSVNKATYRWLDKVIIEENFCPFAKAPRLNNSIRLKVAEESDTALMLQHLLEELEYLIVNKNIETSLVVYSCALEDFNDYLDFLEFSNELLFREGYEGIFQLASFHPDYCFEGTPQNCASNYTNRSPYPMIHVIREASIERALTSFSKPERIPLRNIEHAKTLGKCFFEKYGKNS